MYEKIYYLTSIFKKFYKPIIINATDELWQKFYTIIAIFFNGAKKFFLYIFVRKMVNKFLIWCSLQLLASEFEQMRFSFIQIVCDDSLDPNVECAFYAKKKKSKFTQRRKNHTGWQKISRNFFLFMRMKYLLNFS